MSETTPPNPSFDEDVRKAIDAQPFLGFVGVTVETVEPGYVELVVPFRSNVADAAGGFHGGLYAALADVAGAAAALSLMPAGKRVRTVEFKANALAPATGVQLFARGEAIRATDTLATCQTDLYCVDDAGSETLVATALGTFIASDAAS